MSDQDIHEPKKKAMPFLDHLEELRQRFLKIAVAVVLFSMVAFYFRLPLLEIIKWPLGDVQLYNIEVTGAFYAYLKIAVITGIVASLPVLFYQLWSFVAPGLFPNEKMTVLPLVFVSTFLFVVGACFSFVLVLPTAFTFLLGFSGEMVVDNITIGSYINFVGLMLITFGLGFQLPVVAYFLGKLGIVDSQYMGKARPYAVVLFLILAAIITPPDVFTQILLAGPMYLLYEVSIIVVRLTGKQKSIGETIDDHISPYSEGKDE